MIKTCSGVYVDGKIELKEKPQGVRDRTPVIVTFLEPHAIDASTHDRRHANFGGASPEDD